MEISKPACHPFNNSDADVILRSSDEVPTDFRVFKLLLSLASPFFAQAFTLPQPESTDPIPVMEMEEDQHTLELVLGLCYPISIAEPPYLTSLKDLQLVVQAAVKFDMEGIQQHVRKVIVEPRFIETQPLRVFAVTCCYKWDTEANSAAWYWLRQPADTPLIDELELISGATYHRLLQYRRKCGETGAAEVASLSSWNPGSGWIWDENPACCVEGTRAREQGKCMGPRYWWLAWMQGVADELLTRPWGRVANKAGLFESTAVREIKICEECARDTMSQLGDYILVLAGKIDKKIGTVKLNLRN